jgi:hypothetical protein
LGIADHSAGRLNAAWARLEESVRLRREIGLWAGVAADQVGLIYIAAAQDRRDDALELAEEAYATAEACGGRRHGPIFPHTPQMASKLIDIASRLHGVGATAGP